MPSNAPPALNAGTNMAAPPVGSAAHSSAACVWLAAGAAWLVALSVNEAIGFIERGSGAPADFSPVTARAIAFMTTLGMLAGTGSFVLVRRFTGTPILWWRRVGYAALVLSFAVDVPFIGKVPLIFVVGTMIMHVVAGVLLIEALARAAAPQASRSDEKESL